jgi:hypothetical protein
VKRGVALNTPRIAASALYGVDAANVQIDATGDSDSGRGIVAIGNGMATTDRLPSIAMGFQSIVLTKSATRRPRCPGNRWADLVARGLPWLLPS